MPLSMVETLARSEVTLRSSLIVLVDSPAKCPVVDKT